MAQKQGSSKKTRKDKNGRPRGSQKKTGNRGGSRTKLDATTLFMMGKGPIGNAKPMTGPMGFSPGPIWDEKQSKINKVLGYW